ncbi:type VII secretion target [Gordonia sp. ABSL1-1]|uniref:type VII secretion target n=1 Tax=Gordonia sp. ABSL1-1 TaxID=3053923 RepID=UPI0025734939|nr:type VII secretion target [Gordonia sp. ABSL1-1]MDL9938120.1 type VII secretion target [Gordonia sp. ABSL1-1]
MLKVSPDSLRSAANTISTLPATGADALGMYQSASSATMSLHFGAAGIKGTDTAAKIRAASVAAETAVEVVRGRLGAWETVLKKAADTFQDTDERASVRVGSLGDFNGSWDPSQRRR